MAHTRQSRPDSGLGFQVQVLKTCQVVLSSLGSGREGASDAGSEAGSYLRLIDFVSFNSRLGSNKEEEGCWELVGCGRPLPSEEATT